MCLAVPARVVELLPGDLALVELGGVRKETSLALVEDVAPGDYVIVHAGFAIQKLDAAEADKTLALFVQLAATTGPAPAATGAAPVTTGPAPVATR